MHRRRTPSRCSKFPLQWYSGCLGSFRPGTPSRCNRYPQPSCSGCSDKHRPRTRSQSSKCPQRWCSGCSGTRRGHTRSRSNRFLPERLRVQRHSADSCRPFRHRTRSDWRTHRRPCVGRPALARCGRLARPRCGPAPPGELVLGEASRDPARSRLSSAVPSAPRPEDRKLPETARPQLGRQGVERHRRPEPPYD